MNSNQGTGRSDDTINVAPGNENPLIPRPPQAGASSPDWRASSRAGVNRFLNNYRQTLERNFRAMSRWNQENLVQKLCLIVTIGVTALGLLLFYRVVPGTIRVFMVPCAIVAAWWAANRVVTPVVLARLEDVLNKE